MMKRYFLLIAAGIFILNSIEAQDLKSFQIYDKSGNAVNFGGMINNLGDYDIVLFGEFHNNAIIHWLELRTEEALYTIKGNDLVLGAEMFERDNQSQLDRYLSGAIEEDEFKNEARLWPNFNTDYKPLLDFAKTKNLKFIATNIPRRYAALVSKEGADTLNNLPSEEKSLMMKLPVKVDMNTPGYTEMANLMKEHAGDNFMNFVTAQAVKDATMAESIARTRNRKQLFLHFNGNYHSKNYGGIYWHLKNAKKRLKIAVVSVDESSDPTLPAPRESDLTEFNIVVPSDMTKTY